MADVRRTVLIKEYARLRSLRMLFLFNDDDDNFCKNRKGVQSAEGEGGGTRASKIATMCANFERGGKACAGAKKLLEEKFFFWLVSPLTRNYDPKNGHVFDKGSFLDDSCVASQYAFANFATFFCRMQKKFLGLDGPSTTRREKWNLFSKNRVGLCPCTRSSNGKRLWVAGSVKKNCLKCQNFRIIISSNYSKNLGKISSNIFSLKTDCYVWLLSWYLLEISDYTVVHKNISKI